PVFAHDQTFGESEKSSLIVSQVWQSRDRLAYYSVAIAAKIRPGGNVIGISQKTPVQSIIYMMERMKYYAQEMGLKWIAMRGSKTDYASGGRKAMSNLPIEYKDVDIILAYNDSNAQGALLALKENGVDDAIAVGVNGGLEALNGVKMGTQTASVRLDANNIGKQLVWGVYNYLSG